MCLIKDTQHLIPLFPTGRVRGDDCAAHVGARHDCCGWGAGRGMVVVKAHYDFCVAVIECYGVDLDEDFVGAWDG